MMVEGFEAFLRHHATAIESIVRFSYGELTPGDVHNEAYLQAIELAAATGIDVDLSDDDQAREVLKRVRRVFERTKRAVRKTRSLDQPLGEEGTPSLLDLIADDDGAHPLSLLEDIEEQSAAAEPFECPDPYHSELAAWNWLLRRLGFRNRALAEFLMISTSWCYERRKRMRTRFDVSQTSLPQAIAFAEDEGALRPWRKFKLPGAASGDDPRQTALDFWNMPAQPAAGQLWLL